VQNSIQTNFYLNRYQFSDQEIFIAPQGDLNMVVVIPCFKEPQLIESLASILACDLPLKATEVIVVVNCSEMAEEELKQQNQIAFDEAKQWSIKHSSEKLSFHVIKHLDLPKKHAGVGLARKIGMDEAVRRLEWVNNPNGIIVCFDADSKVDTNYLVEIEKHFKNNTKTTACSIHYEHPLEGVLEKVHYTGIINYEMHLRYYIHALKYTGYINAYQTIGSSMAVRSLTYQKQGGMNRRKAGEDFYFLHKIIPLDNFSEIKSTKVIPSPRQSDRVPFGTGKAIGDFINEVNQIDYPTYNFSCFEDLRLFLADVSSFYSIDQIDLNKYPEAIEQYMNKLDFQKNITEIRRQSSNLKTFINRFYRWFDGLKVLQYVHFSRDHFHSNIDIKVAVLQWNDATTFLSISADSTKKEILIEQRLWDRSI
jgi:cellulose synthase/poly-beta-1,6-N-acetylglucosamine synthase-like glycosyltransferase